MRAGVKIILTRCTKNYDNTKCPQAVRATTSREIEIVIINIKILYSKIVFESNNPPYIPYSETLVLINIRTGEFKKHQQKTGVFVWQGKLQE